MSDDEITVSSPYEGGGSITVSADAVDSGGGGGGSAPTSDPEPPDPEPAPDASGGPQTTGGTPIDEDDRETFNQADEPTAMEQYLADNPEVSVPDTDADGGPATPGGTDVSEAARREFNQADPPTPDVDPVAVEDAQMLGDRGAQDNRVTVDPVAQADAETLGDRGVQDNRTRAGTAARVDEQTTADVDPSDVQVDASGDMSLTRDARQDVAAQVDPVALEDAEGLGDAGAADNTVDTGPVEPDSRDANPGFDTAEPGSQPDDTVAAFDAAFAETGERIEAVTGLDLGAEDSTGQASQVRAQFPGAADQIESQLEERTGAELDAEDITLTRDDGRVRGRLSREGQEAVAVQNAPAADTLLGGLTTTGARIRQDIEYVTDPVANTFREQTPGRSDVFGAVGEAAGAGVDALADTATDVTDAATGTDDDTVTQAGVAAGVTGVGTGAAAGGSLGAAALGTGVGAAALGVGAVAAGVATGGVEQRRVAVETSPTAGGELQPGETVQDQTELQPGDPAQRRSELEPGAPAAGATELGVLEEGTFVDELGAPAGDVFADEVAVPTSEGGTTTEAPRDDTVVPGDFPLPGRDVPADPGREFVGGRDPSAIAEASPVGQQAGRETGEQAGERVREPRETITGDEIVTELPEIDQPGPSVREQQRRDDLTAPERSFPTGAGAVAGVETEPAQQPQQRLTEAQQPAAPTTTVPPAVEPVAPLPGLRDRQRQAQQPAVAIGPRPEQVPDLTPRTTARTTPDVTQRPLTAQQPAQAQAQATSPLVAPATGTAPANPLLNPVEQAFGNPPAQATGVGGTPGPGDETPPGLFDLGDEQRDDQPTAPARGRANVPFANPIATTLPGLFGGGR